MSVSKNTDKLRLYSRDASWYETYQQKLADEANAGFQPALERMSAHGRARAAGEYRLADAQQVYAGEHGFESWPGVVEYLAGIASGTVRDGFPGFIQAVERGELDAVRSALDAEPTWVDAIASTHKSVLHSAQEMDVIECLLERGAQVECQVPLAGGTALVHALIWGRSDKAERLARRMTSPINLRVAAGLGRLEIIRAARDANGTLTPAACVDRDYYRPNYGWFAWTPSTEPQEVLDEALIYAATCGQVAAMDALVAMGADVNGVAYGTRPITRAAWKARTETIDWLLDHGADIDGAGWLGGHAQGTTALHLASSDGEVELVRHLLARGADPERRDALYDSPAAGWAKHFGHDQLAADIRNRSL